MARYPDYQVELLEPTPNTPTSLGLVKFQQASLKRNSIYPCLPLSSPGLQSRHKLGREKAGKRPVLALPLPVSIKRPKQNPQPMGRGGGNNKGKGLFSGQSAKREKAME